MICRRQHVYTMRLKGVGTIRDSFVISAMRSTGVLTPGRALDYTDTMVIPNADLEVPIGASEYVVHLPHLLLDALVPCFHPSHKIFTCCLIAWRVGCVPSGEFAVCCHHCMLITGTQIQMMKTKMSVTVSSHGVMLPGKT